MILNFHLFLKIYRITKFVNLCNSSVICKSFKAQKKKRKNNNKYNKNNHKNR